MKPTRRAFIILLIVLYFLELNIVDAAENYIQLAYHYILSTRTGVCILSTLYIRQGVGKSNFNITTLRDIDTHISTTRACPYTVFVWTIYVPALLLSELGLRRTCGVTYCFPLPPGDPAGVTALLKCIQYHSFPTFQLPLASWFLKPEPFGLSIHCCKMFSNASQLA